MSSPYSRAPFPPTFPRLSRTEPIYEALYAFTAETNNELSMIENEIMVVLTHSDKGWSLAKRRYGDARGWVPTAFLQQYRPVVSSSAAPLPSSSSGTSSSSSSSGTSNNTEVAPAAPTSSDASDRNMGYGFEYPEDAAFEAYRQQYGIWCQRCGWFY
ncbi:hypothetical protein IWX90DRAFT_45891 [Phyllosticta citrichinensis]|uniref:SH3 domain-containing protein n=1 Tax=Phyllosticta citrichinensis TaxID=1130410 RepID=A0ABR1XHU3_9PEZI